MKQVLQKSGGIAVAVVLCLYGVMALRGPNGIAALAAKRKQVQVLQEQNATLAAENAEKRKRIELLKNDPATQELEIRDRLKLVKPGETQFLIPGGKSDSSATPNTVPQTAVPKAALPPASKPAGHTQP